MIDTKHDHHNPQELAKQPAWLWVSTLGQRGPGHVSGIGTALHVLKAPRKITCAHRLFHNRRFGFYRRLNNLFTLGQGLSKRGDARVEFRGNARVAFKYGETGRRARSTFGGARRVRVTVRSGDGLERQDDRPHELHLEIDIGGVRRPAG